MVRRTPRLGQRFVAIRPEHTAEHLPTDAQLDHAVEAAGSAVREATANLAEAYATLQHAEAQLRAYRSLFCGQPTQSDPAAKDKGGSSGPGRR